MKFNLTKKEWSNDEVIISYYSDYHNPVSVRKRLSGDNSEIIEADYKLNQPFKLYNHPEWYVVNSDLKLFMLQDTLRTTSKVCNEIMIFNGSEGYWKGSIFSCLYLS